MKLLGSFAFPGVGLWEAILVPPESEPRTPGDYRSRLHNAPEAVSCCVTSQEKSAFPEFLTQTLCLKPSCFTSAQDSHPLTRVVPALRSGLLRHLAQLKKLLSPGFTQKGFDSL